MEIINDYSLYLSKIGKSPPPLCIYSGEVGVLRAILENVEPFPTGLFYVWDNLNDEGRTVLLKAMYDGESLRIIKGWIVDKTIFDIAKSLEIDDIDAAIRWWNLCYYRDPQGKVRYDSYYDENLFAANKTEKKMSELKESIAQWIENSFVGVDGLIYVLGDLADCNPVIYQLQQRGLEVKTLPMDSADSVSDDNDRLLQLRDRLALPYCDSNQINISIIASDGIDNCPAECHRSYLITIPIDLISINDIAVGSFSYKEILPSEEFYRDYSCCGHDYSYVEMELFADLHGNTVLKTTNSKAVSKYSIINKFNYTNLQKDGQFN